MPGRDGLFWSAIGQCSCDRSCIQGLRKRQCTLSPNRLCQSVCKLGRKDGCHCKRLRRTKHACDGLLPGHRNCEFAFPPFRILTITVCVKTVGQAAKQALQRHGPTTVWGMTHLVGRRCVCAHTCVSLSLAWVRGIYCFPFPPVVLVTLLCRIS